MDESADKFVVPENQEQLQASAKTEAISDDNAPSKLQSIAILKEIKRAFSMLWNTTQKSIFSTSNL